MRALKTEEILEIYGGFHPLLNNMFTVIGSSILGGIIGIGLGEHYHPPGFLNNFGSSIKGGLIGLPLGAAFGIYLVING